MIKGLEIHLLYYLTAGISIKLTSALTSQWRDFKPQNVGIISSIDLLCIAIAAIIWVKYISKNGRLTGNKRLVGLVVMCVGILIGAGLAP